MCPVSAEVVVKKRKRLERQAESSDEESTQSNVRSLCFKVDVPPQAPFLLFLCACCNIQRKYSVLEEEKGRKGRKGFYGLVDIKNRRSRKRSKTNEVTLISSKCNL